MSGGLTFFAVDPATPAPAYTVSAAGEEGTTTALMIPREHTREASVQLIKITRKAPREVLFNIHDTDDWLLVPEHDRKAKRILIGYLEARGKQNDVFVVLIVGEISFMIDLRESFLDWNKGVNKVMYDLSQGAELWVEHNNVAKAWLELQLKALD